MVGSGIFSGGDRIDPRARVVVVGAGFVGLMVAEALLRSGYRVAVVDAGSVDATTREAVTRTSTRGDVRHASVLEALAFRPRSDGACDGPARQGSVETGNAAGVAVSARISAAGLRSWREFLTRAQGSNLADHVRDDGALVVYPAGPQWEAGLSLQRASHEDPTEVEPLDQRSLSGICPALAGATSGGRVRVVRIPALAFRAQSFRRALIEWLAGRGVAFHFGVPVTGIESAARGAYRLLPTELGDVDAVVLATSLADSGLSRGTLGAFDVFGWLGVWASFDGVGAAVPFKLPAGDGLGVSNFLPLAGDRVVGSGGYAYAGPERLTPTGERVARDDLGARLLEQVRELFPRATLAASGGGVECAYRPCTPSGGLFRAKRSRNGLILKVGFNGPGGLTQSTVIGEAVVAALEGKPHFLHAIYEDPSRLRAASDA